MNLTGLILAAGGSSRMGCDKAALRYKGQSFLEVAKAQLNGVGCKDIYVNNAENLADLIADLGPLGGIYTALTAHPNVAYWLIIPIDMPLLTPEIFSLLQADLQDADMVRFDHEIFPLLLKSSAAMRDHITKLATDKTRTYSMRQFMKPFNINISLKPKASETAFVNINSPEDYEKLCV